jgi:hypothetical protein
VLTADRDDPISNVAELRYLEANLGKGLVEVSDHPAHPGMAAEDRLLPADQLVHRRMPLDLGMELVQQPVDVSAVPPLPARA